MLQSWVRHLEGRGSVDGLVGMLVGRSCRKQKPGRPRIHVLRPRLTDLEPLRALLGGARFIAWRLRCPSSGDCRRGQRHFSVCRSCLGNGSAPEPTLKKALCHTCSFVVICVVTFVEMFNKEIDDLCLLSQFTETNYVNVAKRVHLK